MNLIAKMLTEKMVNKKDLAKHLNVTTQSVANWINGKSSPRIYRLPQIANYLECGVHDLVEGNGLDRSMSERLNAIEKHLGL